MTPEEWVETTRFGETYLTFPTEFEIIYYLRNLALVFYAELYYLTGFGAGGWARYTREDLTTAWNATLRRLGYTRIVNRDEDERFPWPDEDRFR